MFLVTVPVRGKKGGQSHSNVMYCCGAYFSPVCFRAWYWPGDRSGWVSQSRGWNGVSGCRDLLKEGSPEKFGKVSSGSLTSGGVPGVNAKQGCSCPAPGKGLGSYTPTSLSPDHKLCDGAFRGTYRPGWPSAKGSRGCRCSSGQPPPQGMEDKVRWPWKGRPGWAPRECLPGHSHFSWSWP